MIEAVKQIDAPTDSTIVTVDELQQILINTKGSKFVGFVALTVPDMKKTNNPYFNTLQKETSIYNAIINWTYETSVNKQRIREGKEPDFEALPRVWGSRIKGTPLVEYNGKYYLEVRMGNVKAQRFLNNGIEISKEEIEPFLRIKKNEGQRQELDKPIILRDYELRSIKEIKMGGTSYKIRV